MTNRIYYDEISNVSDDDIKKIGKIMDKSNRKKHRTMLFWRLIGCKIFGHKADSKKTHMVVMPGLYCARCFSWVTPSKE